MIAGEIKRSDKYISHIAIWNITCNYKNFDQIFTKNLSYVSNKIGPKLKRFFQQNLFIK